MSALKSEIHRSSDEFTHNYQAMQGLVGELRGHAEQVVLGGNERARNTSHAASCYMANASAAEWTPARHSLSCQLAAFNEYGVMCRRLASLPVSDE